MSKVIPSETQNRLEALIGRCKEGDRQAFTCLYKITSEKVYRLCFRILKHEELTKDVVQEIFLKIWTRAHTYHPSRGEAMHWILRIARNCAIDRLRNDKMLRSRLIQDSTGLDNIAIADNMTENNFSDDEMLHILNCCIAELPERQSTSIKLTYFNGMSNAELAKQMNVPLGSVKTWIRRGLYAVRICVKRPH